MDFDKAQESKDYCKGYEDGLEAGKIIGSIQTVKTVKSRFQEEIQE